MPSHTELAVGNGHVPRGLTPHLREISQVRAERPGDYEPVRQHEPDEDRHPRQHGFLDAAQVEQRQHAQRHDLEPGV